MKSNLGFWRVSFLLLAALFLVTAASRPALAQFQKPADTGQLLQARATLSTEDETRAVAFSPDGKTVATTAGRAFQLWDAATGKLKIKVDFSSSTNPEAHKRAIQAITYSPDGKTIATGGEDYTIKLWDAETGKFRATIEGHEDQVRSIAFSPDGTMLASGSYDTTMKLWDPATGSLKATLRMPGEGTSRVSQPVTWVAYSSDGKTLVTTTSGFGKARLWDASTGNLKKTFDNIKPLFRGMLSPDGRTLLTTGDGDKAAKLWDVATGRIRATLSHEEDVRAVAFSPDGRTVATASLDKTAKLWDTTTGKLKATLRGHINTLYSIAFSPDGRTIVTGANGQARLWDVPSN
ncbi:MAG TPA: WD40 repeat domain-containing protein [Terriglobales bacterium]|nr:WD40 repeat domain-containing protein [Terriglobales bacterium]